MAKVELRPIGSPLEKVLAPEEVAKNRERMQALNQTLEDRRAEIAAGWGPKYAARVTAKGKMTSWQRIEALKDPGSRVFTFGTFVNYGLTFGEDARTSPAAGVITAFVKVCDKYVVVIANDNAVASGSWWPLTPEKIERGQEIALRLKLPVVYLVDCSGLFLPEQARTFPGKTGAGRIFRMNSLLSDAHVPQIAGVFGDCIAGGGYMPIISDKVLMTEQAYMVIAGAALIKGAKTQHITSLDIGGPDIHVHVSNTADERAPDDETLLVKIRREISHLPSSAVPYYRFGAEAAPTRFDPAELDALFPRDHRMTYDIRQVIARLSDNSVFGEVMTHTGKEMVTGIARLGGLYVGIIANDQALSPHPQQPGQLRPGGILYKEGIAKISAFSRVCNDDGIPIVWLQDISGFDIGLEAEKEGLLGYGSNLIYTNSTNTTPMITVLLRKASGAGYYAMAGMPYDPVLQLSTPLTRLAVMEGRTLAIGAYNTKLDDNFQIVTKDPKERAEIEAGMKAVEERISSDMDPYRSAKQMDTDEIVAFHELRDYLVAMAEMAYQSTGYRRVKNPRIWSLHDLEVLTRGVLAEALAKPEPTAIARKDGGKTEAAAEAPVPEGLFAVRAPTFGIFYRRGSPDSPPYVEQGQKVERGAVLGLVEVMKCFHQIVLGGPGEHAPGEQAMHDAFKHGTVEKILATDAQEVKPGQALLWIRPA
ncbi:MAG TPA: carboxyl transferase domain-containing protein [Myxococcales bacterium]|jgi:acetyl-CoA carboxylase carboxyltransferase component